jgi:hypothetical protein
VLTAADPSLDDRALDWLVGYVDEASDGRMLSRSQLQAEAAKLLGGNPERRRKRLRLYYLGDVLLRLERGGLTKQQATVAAPYVARGAVVPRSRRRREPLTQAERRGALHARKQLDDNARERDLSPRPLPRARAPGDRQRKARAERLHRERVAAQARREARVVEFDFYDPLRLRLLLAALSADKLPAEYEEDGAELAEALGFLGALDPELADRLRRDPMQASDADLEWLVAQTRTALGAARVSRTAPPPLKETGDPEPEVAEWLDDLGREIEAA